MNFYQSLGYLVFGSRLKRLGEGFINDVNRIYKMHNIGFDASWFPVFYILSRKNEISIREVSDELGVSHSAASQLLSSLQQKGFIKTSVSKKDARKKVVLFTAKGEKLLAKIKPVWSALENAMIELAGEGTESKQILTALSEIESNLQSASLLARVASHLS